MVEKAVELGVFELFPVVSKYTVSDNRFSETKITRLRKIIVSAMGQSQRCYLPELHNIISFNDMLGLTENENNKVVYYEHAAGNNVNKSVFTDSGLSILIGPEGGFDKTEIEKLIENNWQVKSLGNRKLRAETAAIVSIFEQFNYSK